ncbi:MAG: DUF3313 domain-containing protein [Xanthomonadales bacterium]|nr:DUF3313 domain-containing protein [Xanthomonadales bacterium]
MKFFKPTLTIIFLVTGLLALTPAWAKKDLPAVNDEGMELVKDSELATVYADPGADLGIYKRILLEDATVAFKKNWQRDQNRGYGLKVRNSDMERITEDVATLFNEIFTEQLTKGGYEITTEPGPDVLTIKPAIVDLDVYAPDVSGASFTRSYSESAGEMTLNLELFDSLTGDKIAKATDRKRDWDKGYLEWRTRVSNRADATRAIRSWAKAFTSLLDEAKS